MKSYHILSLVLVTVLAFPAVGLFTATATPLLPADAAGSFTVSIYSQGNWRVLGSLAYDKMLSPQSLDISDYAANARWIFIRLEHSGETAANIDAALLDDLAPKLVYGAVEESSLALRKLSRRDYDVIDAQGKKLMLVYQKPKGNPVAFTLTARVEPPNISDVPFQFPLENLYQGITPDSTFYNYRWGDQPGSLTLDGDLEGESLGQPFFAEFVRPDSGHPEGIVHGWVSNDSQNLYVALDFVSDNTMDGDKDYAKVYLNTRSAVRVFKVSMSEQVWGKPGFVYTPRACYQHKVYEIAIPLTELGMENLSSGDSPNGVTLPLAFALYGTASVNHLYYYPFVCRAAP